MNNSEHFERQLQTILISLLKYPPTGFRVDRNSAGGTCSLTFDIPAPYTADVLRPLYENENEGKPMAPPTKDHPDVNYIRGMLSSRAPAVEGNNGYARTTRLCTWLARQCPHLAPENIVRGMDEWNARCSPPWKPEELLQKLQRAYAEDSEARYGAGLPKGPDVPPYGATVANSPQLGARHRGWKVCDKGPVPAPFYMRSACCGELSTVNWTVQGWVLRSTKAHLGFVVLGRGSLDEALDRAKEMMG